MAGYTNTTLINYVAPEFENFKARKIICSGITLKFHFQKKLIEGLKRRVKNYNIEIIDEYEIFPPTNGNYMLSNLTKAANNGLFDSFWEISVSESLVNNFYHSSQITHFNVNLRDHSYSSLQGHIHSMCIKLMLGNSFFVSHLMNQLIQDAYSIA